MKIGKKTNAVKIAAAALTLFAALWICPVLAAGADQESAGGRSVFYLFYSLTCTRCWDARKFVQDLRRKYTHIEFRELEVVKSRENQEVFNHLAETLDIRTPGVPVFIFGNSYHVGFKEGNSAKREIVGMIERELRQQKYKIEDGILGHGEPRLPELRLPLLGVVDARSLSLPAFTLFIGLLDGVNPCALWVLMLLLSLLVNAGSRSRMIVVGAVFIFFSAALYFCFMVAWFNFFALLGLKNTATLILGIGVCLLGIVNTKELFWFKKGFSLTIPDRAKPKIFDRMRRVVSSPNGFLLVAGTAALAFLVNLAEFGCTIGLPAVYTRVLTLQETGLAGKYLFMALYNVVYVVPLAAVLAAFVFTFGKFRLSERHGRILKIVTGLVMLALGLLLTFRPGYLMFS
jgi:cytochrome c biogenesis protein CcdA